MTEAPRPRRRIVRLIETIARLMASARARMPKGPLTRRKSAKLIASALGRTPERPRTRRTIVRAIALALGRMPTGPRKRRTIVRLIGLAACSVAGGALVLGLVLAGQAIHGGVSAFWLYVGGLAATGLAVLYLLSDTPGFRLAAQLVFHSLLMVPLIPLLWIAGWGMRAIGAIHVRVGRLDTPTVDRPHDRIEMRN